VAPSVRDELASLRADDPHRCPVPLQGRQDLPHVRGLPPGLRRVLRRHRPRGV